MLFFRSYFFKGAETDLNKLVKQLALNSTRVTLESSQANISLCASESHCSRTQNTEQRETVITFYHVIHATLTKLTY